MHVIYWRGRGDAYVLGTAEFSIVLGVSVVCGRMVFSVCLSAGHVRLLMFDWKRVEGGERGTVDPVCVNK